MRTLIVATVLAGLVGPAPALAQPPDLMQRLERYCISTGGDGAGAIRLAREDGFVAPPPAMMKSMPPEMRDMDALWNVYEGGVAFLLIGKMADRRSPLKGDVCAVASMPPSASATTDMERWLGAKLGRDSFALYLQADDGSRRMLPRSDEVAAREAMRRGRLHAAGAMTQEQMSMLILIKVSQ